MSILGLRWKFLQDLSDLCMQEAGWRVKKDWHRPIKLVYSDYRGEIMVALHNHSNEDITIESGERVAQMVIAPYIFAEYEEVSELEDTVRGEGGFGSTGTK